MKKPIFSLLLPLLVVLCLSSCSEDSSAVSTPKGADAPAESVAVAPAATPVSELPAGELTTGELTTGEQKRAVDSVMQARAKQQAEGLGSGKVVVNRAWNYKGYSYLSPDPAAAIEARLVAVDVTISGHTPFFDIDDIEIVDGITMISYGSDPHPERLKLDGTLMPADEISAAAPTASRWLLIYAFPKNTTSFHLVYWGHQLTAKPVPVQDEGLALPFPAAE